MEQIRLTTLLRLEIWTDQPNFIVVGQ